MILFSNLNIFFCNWYRNTCFIWSFGSSWYEKQRLNEFSIIICLNFKIYEGMSYFMCLLAAKNGAFCIRKLVFRNTHRVCSIVCCCQLPDEADTFSYFEHQWLIINFREVMCMKYDEIMFMTACSSSGRPLVHFGAVDLFMHNLSIK